MAKSVLQNSEIYERLCPISRFYFCLRLVIPRISEQAVKQAVRPHTLPLVHMNMIRVGAHCLFLPDGLSNKCRAIEVTKALPACLHSVSDGLKSIGCCSINTYACIAVQILEHLERLIYIFPTCRGNATDPLQQELWLHILVDLCALSL